jgi:hypothetical protein
MSRVHGGAHRVVRSTAATVPGRRPGLDPTIIRPSDVPPDDLAGFSGHGDGKGSQAALIPAQRASRSEPPGRAASAGGRVAAPSYANAGPDVFWAMPDDTGAAQR